MTVLIINAALLVVGTFMDMIPALLVFTLLLLPFVTELRMEPVRLRMDTMRLRVDTVRVARAVLPMFAAMVLALFTTSVSILSPRLPRVAGA